MQIFCKWALQELFFLASKWSLTCVSLWKDTIYIAWILARTGWLHREGYNSAPKICLYSLVNVNRISRSGPPKDWKASSTVSSSTQSVARTWRLTAFQVSIEPGFFLFPIAAVMQCVSTSETNPPGAQDLPRNTMSFHQLRYLEASGRVPPPSFPVNLTHAYTARQADSCVIGNSTHSKLRLWHLVHNTRIPHIWSLFC